MRRERLLQWIPMKGRAAVAAGALLMTGVAAGWGLSGPALDAAATRVHAAPTAAAASPQARPGLPAPESYADLVARVSPAVVTIRAERVTRQAALPSGHEPLFDELFGRQGRRMVPEPREEGGLGSGVIVSPDGYILTNHHVVDGATVIRVELVDRRAFAAKVVGTDEPSDLAVLKIEAAGLLSLPLGDSRKVRVGDVVLAIGNPLGVGQTVTMGIISAKGRATGVSDASFEDFLQTDAPINRGNSGGALVDTRGGLVGINSQILTPSGGSIGIGFAIPADMAQNVMQQLIETGTVRRGRMGVTVQGITSDLAQSLGLEDVRGAIVSSVDEGSPAAKAGIRRGDVITAFDGEPVSDNNWLRNRVAGSQPGSTVSLTVVRNGRKDTRQVVLAEREETRRASNDAEGRPDRGRYGMAVATLTPEMASQLGVRAKGGLVVEDVTPASAASQAGIREGDVIVEVNRQPVNNLSQFQEAVKASGSRPALLLVNRRGGELYLALPARAEG